ncbi:flavodoxin family protein [Sporosalibacterium faouarense]|uniref:flavodoxin family protein n=1 Tax=Sporosalibacterium faouarense TaxID=516123 RepID=UPI00141C5A71|nr:NAD(P)H-dependent oxidoreductase [Sporosalibacterium faouarense]MTI46910.1 NAD(P)H-dependent oxidoreductase [Bacillota bacterium]
MKELYLIIPEKPSNILSQMVDQAISSLTSDNQVTIINNEINLPDLKNKKILFAIETNEAGYNIGISKIFTELYKRGKDSLYGSHGGILIHSDNELFTKSISQDILFHANQLGCRFPGRPIIEATGSLGNLLTLQKVIKKPLEEVCLTLSEKLGNTIISDNPKLIENPNILVLHASNRKTSNTLNLWDMVKKHLKGHNIKEIHIENGTVRDCFGCPYKTCKHYGEQTSCFYGGIMVEEVYPAILEADAVVWICPNYNDSLSANMSAVINRLTALFRKTKFYDKSIFGVIVSGNSGSDVLSKQLISALNVNKTFRLPPYFSIMATANDKGAIFRIPDIEREAERFAKNMIREIKA